MEKLNGYKAPLIVSGASLLPVAAALITMWSDVRELKTAEQQRIKAETIATLEARVRGIEECIRTRGCVPISIEATERLGCLEYVVKECRR